jgi:hypothetical protein
VNDGALTVGGGMPCNGIGPYTANGLSWVPTTNCDTFEIHVATWSSGIVLNAILDGGATLGSVNCYQATNPYPEQKFTVTGSLGAYTLNLVPASSSGGVWPIMIIGTNSAVKEVSILNGGWYAADAAQISTLSARGYGIANWNPLPGINQIAPDLTIITVGSMDAYQSTSLPTFTANLQSVITESLLSGSVILVSNAPFGTSVVSVANQQSYIAAMKSLALSNNIPLIDVFSLMYGGSQALASNLGVTYSGTQHLSRFDTSRRLAALVVFAREMKAILKDAAIVMFDKMLGSVFRRADQAHKVHMVDRAKALDASTRALLVGMAKAMLAANASEYNSAGYALVAGWVATALNGFVSAPATLPPVYDAIAAGTGSDVTTLSTGNLTTSNPNELIYVTVVSQNPNLNISDTAGLNWIPRVSLSNGNNLISWYAIAPSVLTNDVITITGSAIYEVVAYAFTKGGLFAPSLPQAPFTSNFSGAALSISSSQNRGLVFGAYNTTQGSPTAGSGWTQNTVQITY